MLVMMVAKRALRKNMRLFENFAQHGRGIFSIPKKIANLPIIFWHAKFIPRFTKEGR